MIRQRDTPAGAIRFDVACDMLQRTANVTVARRVDRQRLEAARYTAARKQLVSLGGQYVDAAAHSVQYRLVGLITCTELAALPLFHRVDQQFCDQVWQVIGIVFDIDKPCPMRAIQIGSVQHQQPEVAHGNAPQHATADHIQGVVSRFRHGCHHQSCNSWSPALRASSGASNQYSSSNGRISVSTTSMNHWRVESASSTSVGVT
ncbi:hypothetical protein D3C72_1516700 [compost metagenome]